MRVYCTGPMVIIEPAQDFGPAQVADFLARVESASLDDAHAVAIDLKNVAMLNSSALGALVAAAKTLAERHATLELHHLSGELLQLFADTAVDRFFDIMLPDDTRQPASVSLFAPCGNIKLDIERLNAGTVCILRLKGLMNHPAGSRLFHQQFLLNLLEYRHFLLDFEQLTFFDSLCVRELLALHELLQKTGGSMRIAGCNFLILELFSTLSIDRIIPCYPSRDEALKGWDAAHD